ncbi:hypothetical protein [Rhodopseudomonas sp. P2A-2r]|uniref:hypothetical protein n=1 Tax=unclassified Rhodopseudomonas TaxID=2638247 RepID=UPI00223462E1|nr:hypothetical protein [Rhodopseudomonas sp. P2A-2r]UZE52410.1 hypothetical protein ONR75_22000 [Rhodopseudomonas sp. P2A-2r]
MTAKDTAVGATPLLQFEPTVQSLLVAPVHVWAAAEPTDRAISAVADAPAMNKRSHRILLPPGDRCVRLERSCRMSSSCRRLVASPMHWRMIVILFSLGRTVRDANL